MSQDLLTQLADYGAYCEERQGSVLADDVIGNVAPSPEPTLARSPGSRRGWLVAAGAAALTLILVGGAAWLARSDGTVEPATPTTTLAPPETTPSTLIPAPPPESLNQSQIQAQAGFLAAFRERGFLSDGNCQQRPEGGPSECTVQIDSPALGGPVTRTFTVPGNMQTSFMGDAFREVAEEGLAALYVWALETYPDETAARCGVGFEGDRTAVAWSPGYAATSTCGDHLAGLLTEFTIDTVSAEPPEPPRELDQPDPSAGLWSHVETETPEGVPRLGALFDVAETPVGLLATGVDGLWISQDAVEWQPYARDSVEFDDGGFSKIAVSDLGIVVSKVFGDEPASWFSPDGESWTPIDRWRSGLAVSGNGLAASDERFLLIDRSRRPPQRRVMSSTDGTNWQIVEALETSDFHLVEATPFGFFAATRDGGVWTSPDGVEWSNLSNQMLGAVPNDIAGSQSGLVAVTGDGRILHSPDGAQWTDVHSLTPAEDWEHACTRVGASEIGFLVVATHVGHVDSWPDLDDLDSAVATAWFSEDGRAWSRVATDTQGHGYVCQNEVIPYEGGFLSVTDSQLPILRLDMVWLYER